MFETAGLVGMILVAVGSAPHSERVSAGPVTAELRYTVTWHENRPRDLPPWEAFSRLRVVVRRDGRVVYRAPLYDDECEYVRGGGLSNCHPAREPRLDERARSIALRDLDADGEPEAIVDLRLGGTHDRCYTVFLRHTPPTYTPLRWAFDEPCYELRELDDDSAGVPEIVATDTEFTARFATGTPSYVRPLRISHYDRGRLVDVTQRFPGLIRRERDRLWRAFLRIPRSRNGKLGVLAAWAADEYRLGRRDEALRTLHRLNRRKLLREKFSLPKDAHDERYIAELDRYLLRSRYGPG